MNITHFKDQLENAAAHLEKTTAPENNHGLTGYVVSGLKHMAANLPDFERSIAASEVFIKSFTRNLKIISNLQNAEDKYRMDPDVRRALLEEVAFSLFEELAVFFKEKTLAAQKTPGPVESGLLAEFENSDNWSPADNGMVCKFYYCYLPGFANGLFSLEKVREFSEQNPD